VYRPAFNPCFRLCTRTLTDRKLASLLWHKERETLQSLYIFSQNRHYSGHFRRVWQFQTETLEPDNLVIGRRLMQRLRIVTPVRVPSGDSSARTARQPGRHGGMANARNAVVKVVILNPPHLLTLNLSVSTAFIIARTC